MVPGDGLFLEHEVVVFAAPDAEGRAGDGEYFVLPVLPLQVAVGGRFGSGCRPGEQGAPQWDQHGKE